MILSSGRPGTRAHAPACSIDCLVMYNDRHCREAGSARICDKSTQYAASVHPNIQQLESQRLLYATMQKSALAITYVTTITQREDLEAYLYQE